MTTNVLEMSVNLVTAHLSQNQMDPSSVPTFIKTIHTTLKELASDTASSPVALAASQDAPSIPQEAPVAQAAPAPAAPTAEASPAALEPAAVEPVAEEDVQEDEESEAPAASAAAAEPVSNKIAYVRDNDLDDPVFEGLDPWLAARITPRTAAKLDINNEIHPSVYPDKLICLEDGKEVKLLRSHLRKRYGLTPAEYIDKWNLPDNYPMAPPIYTANKRKLAKETGLGLVVRSKREKPKGRGKAQTSTPAKAAASSKAAAPAKAAKSTRSATKAKASAGTGSRRTLTLFPKAEQPA